MWSKYDFEELESLHEEIAENYSSSGHPNGDLARAFLPTVQNIHDTHTALKQTQGHVVDDSHKLQLFYLRRGIRALFSLYFATKHHCYSTAYSRARLLLELYIIVREMNRNKEKTEKKFRHSRTEVIENEYDHFDSLPFADYVDGKRRQLNGELIEEYESLDQLYGRLSDYGAHPNSIKTPQWEMERVDVMEENSFVFGLMLAFGLGAQYIRTFENSEIERGVREEMDGMFVTVLIEIGSLPKFFDEDLEFGSQI